MTFSENEHRRFVRSTLYMHLVGCFVMSLQKSQLNACMVQADKYGVPRICFVNKMDRMGADFFNTVKMIISNLAAVPLVLQVPSTPLFAI